MDVYLLLYSSIPVLLCLYWFSCVQRRGCGGSTASTSWGKTADMESLATDRKTVWNMYASDVNACPWHRRCFCQIELMKRSCWSFPPPEVASLPPFLSCPKTVFSKIPLISEPLTYTSPADKPVLYSRVLQTNFGRSHPKNSNCAAPTCIMCINPTNRMRGHDEARRLEASVQRSRPEVGRSIYIHIMTAATLTS